MQIKYKTTALLVSLILLGRSMNVSLGLSMYKKKQANYAINMFVAQTLLITLVWLMINVDDAAKRMIVNVSMRRQTKQNC